LSLVISTSVANILHNARRYEEAVEQCRKVLELDPGFHWAHHSLGEDYIEMGKFKEGVAELTLGVDPGRRNPHFRAKLAYGLARAGDRRGAVKILDELERESRTRYIPPTQIAAVHAALGNTQGAFDWLDKAYRVRDSWIPQITVEPPFRPLHSDPRLGILLRRVGLQLAQ
jgi:tetratricopeptide (TPR) repeat protein